MTNASGGDQGLTRSLGRQQPRQQQLPKGGGRYVLRIDSVIGGDLSCRKMMVAATAAAAGSAGWSTDAVCCARRRGGD
jgi:hypothetical protein